MTPHSASSWIRHRGCSRGRQRDRHRPTQLTGRHRQRRSPRGGARDPGRSAAAPGGLAGTGSGSGRRWRRPVVGFRRRGGRRPGDPHRELGPAIAGTDDDSAAASRELELPYTVEDAIRTWSIGWRPSIRQLIQDLDGETFLVDGQERIVATIMEAEEGEGITTVPTTFTQPGLLHRFPHLGARPEATFFFLVIGLTVAAFEFYAVGPGLAAIAAALALFLASLGCRCSRSTGGPSPAALAAMWLLTVSYQKGGILGLNVIGRRPPHLGRLQLQCRRAPGPDRRGGGGSLGAGGAVLLPPGDSDDGPGPFLHSNDRTRGPCGKTGPGDHRFRPGGGGRGRRRPLAGDRPSRSGNQDPEQKSWSWRYEGGALEVEPGREN